MVAYRVYEVNTRIFTRMLDHYSIPDLLFSWHNVKPGDVVWFRATKNFEDYSQPFFDKNGRTRPAILTTLHIAGYVDDDHPDGIPMYVIGKQVHVSQDSHMSAIYLDVFVPTSNRFGTIRVSANK